MKRMRLAICVAVFALVGGIATSEDMDIRALQAKLAAQEARLNDLQAKMNTSKNAGTPEGIVSMRKNAVVTIGGTVNTRYFYRTAKLESKYAAPSTANGTTQKGNMTKRADTKRGDLRVSDAKLAVKIDVNDNFDAYLRVDLQDNARTDVSGLAQYYWVRWKNICNSGFGVLVGRNNLVFGGVEPIGLIESFGKANGIGDTVAGLNSTLYASTSLTGNQTASYGEGMFAMGSGVPARAAWDYSRTTQITPYWESQDGKIKTELSLMQGIDQRLGGNSTYVSRTNDGVRHDRSRNLGFGTASFRLTVVPVEGLKIVASVLNQRSNSDYNDRTFGIGGTNGYQNQSDRIILNGRQKTTKNNLAAQIGVQWTPCFMDRLTVWGELVQGWNNAWIENLDSTTVSLGAMFAVTNKLTVFGRGEFMNVKNGDALVWHKAKAWATYFGATYKLGYGVALEAGWRHDRFNYKDRTGDTHTKVTADTIYGHLGFSF